ncbi:hypothetical protein [Coxiella-like endosymbiont]|uniref:hypothetical protein n=1 Tax=Coxiella-like endosymbiont TaxID=1592897 RepID=UPI0034E28A4B
MLNLIRNALKFTETSFFKVSVYFSDKIISNYQIKDSITIQFNIEDSGLIPNDKFKMLFEDFSRLMPSYEKFYKGTGI